jgi:hypothetical protein
MRKGTETPLKKRKRERELKIERNEMERENEKVQYNWYERSTNLQLSLHGTYPHCLDRRSKGFSSFPYLLRSYTECPFQTSNISIYHRKEKTVKAK